MTSSGLGESNAEARPGGPVSGSLGLLRIVALTAVVAGAAGSLGLMLRVGNRNNSLILIGLFAGWVLSPFVGLILADIRSNRWSVPTRATLYSLMLLLALGSVAIYANVAFGPPRPQPAFMFLVVPLGSWLLMTTVVPIAALVSGKRSRRGTGT